MKFPLHYLFPEKIPGYVFLCFIWLFTGFALGTLFLLWPLRMWVNYVKHHSYSGFVESMGVVVLIILLVVISLRVSLLLFQLHLNREKFSVTVVVIALPFCCAAGALLLLMNPRLVTNDSEKIFVSKKFTVGPYPTAERLMQLKTEGYTSVISLLHPAVVPFEPELLDEEAVTLKKLHIALIRAPMLPWLADNSAALKIIENLVKNGKDKYYIHCYLGKDRVNVVKNFILKLSGADAINETDIKSSRTFETAGSFERGQLYRLDTLVYMTPFPTDEEFLSFFLAGKVNTVINLMDTLTVPDNKPWARKERIILEQNNLVFKNYAIRPNMTDKEVNRIIDMILTLPKPIVLHQWNSTSPESILFRKHFYLKTGHTQKNLANNNLESY